MTLVILHGWGSSAESFRALKEPLAQSGFSVLVPDMPGFGDAAPPPEPWEVDDYVKWLWEFVKSRKIERFYLLGHSFGGRIGIKFALKHPEKLSGLILYAAAGVKPRKKLRHALLYLIAKIGAPIFSLPFLGGLKNFSQRVLYFFAGTKDYLLAEGVMKETMKNVIEEDLSPFLGEIRARTLLIWGENDQTTLLADARLMNARIRGSELRVIQGAGHSAHKEQPEEFVRILLEFLRHDR